jgi:adenylate cyclase
MSATCFRFDVFTIDLNGLCVTGPWGRVDLRPKSFDVLRYLVEHSDRVATKDALMESVWPGVTVTEQSLTRCIYEIRHALRDESQRIIKTVPKRGYMLEVPVALSSSNAARRGARRKLTRDAWSEAPAGNLPHADRASIAVLPFTNLSGDRDQAYVADGIVEDIITELSRFGELLVVARHSSFQYRRKTVDVRRVSRELGVRYVLEGSVRRGLDRIRITVQLIDGTTGAHCWAERYDGKLKDIFAIQDELTRTIASVLAAQVQNAEVARILATPATSWQAYDLCMRALAPFNAFYASYRASDLYEARHFLEQALRIDPQYGRVHAMLSCTYLSAWIHQLDGDYLNPAALARAHELARRAVESGPNLPIAHENLGFALAFMGRHDESIAAFERAAALNPNFVTGRFGLALVYAGEPARAIKVLAAYRRLEPFYPGSPAGFLGLAYHMLNKYQDATAPLLECTSRAPKFRSGHCWLAANYVRLGELGAARREIAEALRLSPKFTIEQQRRLMKFKRSEDAEHFFSSLRRAGLPEG